MKTTLISAAFVAGAALLGACSADETDFKETAEKVIEDELDGAEASCTEPGGTDVGTTFDCTAELEDGTTATFTAEITKEDEVTVTQTG